MAPRLPGPAESRGFSSQFSLCGEFPVLTGQQAGQRTHSRVHRDEWRLNESPRAGRVQQQCREELWDLMAPGEQQLHAKDDLTQLPSALHC